MYIKEKIDLDIDVSRLKLLKAEHLSRIYSLEERSIGNFRQKLRLWKNTLRAMTGILEQPKITLSVIRAASAVRL